LDSLCVLLDEQVKAAYQARVELNSPAGQRHLERIILLQMVDNHWKDHLLSMDHLKEGIGLRGYGQKNPLIEYKREGFQLFMNTMETVKQQTVSALMRVEIVQEGDAERLEEERRKKREEELRLSRLSAPGVVAEAPQPEKREGSKIGRNADCPCGSGKKYKKCCGKLR
ncbi:MAG: SEC-C domain-containing protein, partial [Desulfobulbaceae bacterium]|nr:SEC-C domain-containing protein [Candidatus Desulfatifera sulfidica]